jgi:hypothetical protein
MKLLDPTTGDLMLGSRALGRSSAAQRSRTLKGKKIAGRTWLVVVHATDGAIRQLTLVNDDPKYGTGWDDATRAKELKRRAAHDAAVTAALGKATQRDDAHFFAQWKMPWGRVESTFDPRSFGSEVNIFYKR